MAVEFWESRTVLQHIRDFARARRTGPWSVLGVSLARSAMTVPPPIVLPAMIGGCMSLNVFVALVGPSGSGKGAAESAARDALTFKDHHGMPIEIEEFPLGSGEGIARTFRSADLDSDAPNDRDAALFSSPEVDTLAALFGRQGATLEGELRKLYSGETIGFNNARKETKSVVAAHTYRACLLVGVQPLRSELLLRGADGGTPQRLVWMPVTDPDAPDDVPPSLPRRIVTVPNWQAGPLDVPEPAKAAVDAHRLAILRGDDDVDPLDGHALLCRLKVAAALMALDGRTRVNEEDWQLAGVVMAVSNRTRAATENAMNDRARQVNRARALALAERDEIVSERKLRRAKEGVLRWLERSPAGLSLNGLRMKLKADVRDYLETALAELEEAGSLVLDSASRRYICTTGTYPENTPSPAETGYVPKVHMSPREHENGPDRPVTPLTVAGRAASRQPRVRRRTRGQRRKHQHEGETA